MISGVEWWPLVIGMLWKMNREDRGEKMERETSVMRKEKTGIK